MKENFINYIPLKIYRYLRWRKGVYQEYRFNKKNFSKKYAKICMTAAKLKRKGASKEAVLDAYHQKDCYVFHHIEDLCGDIFEKYTLGNGSGCASPPPKMEKYGYSGGAVRTLPQTL